MKKHLIRSFLFILIGFLLGEFLFGDIRSSLEKMKNVDTYYFLQEGVYENQDLLQNGIRNLGQRLINIENEQYCVYVGITKSREIANMLKDIYEKRGYNIHIREKNVRSEEFSLNVGQFDLLIHSTEDEDQILTIEKVVLANYEEIIQKK